MPQPKKMYIERKTRDGVSLGHRGPAVIGEVTFSKTGKTIYYKDMAFKRLSGTGIYGNYFLSTIDENKPYDESDYWDEDGNYIGTDSDEFWISGIKQRGSNRYPGYEKHPVIEDGELE